VNTPDLVAEAGIKYFVDWGGADDQPFPIRVRDGGSLLCLPYQFDVNDGINFRFNMEGEAFARSTIELFDQLYRESGDSGRAMCIPLHPFIMGQPHRARHLDTILRHIVAHDGVWMATAGQIAEWYRENCLPELEAHLIEIAAMTGSRAVGSSA